MTILEGAHNIWPAVYNQKVQSHLQTIEKSSSYRAPDIQTVTCLSHQSNRFGKLG